MFCLISCLEEYIVIVYYINHKHIIIDWITNLSTILMLINNFQWITFMIYNKIKYHIYISYNIYYMFHRIQYIIKHSILIINYPIFMYYQSLIPIKNISCYPNTLLVLNYIFCFRIIAIAFKSIMDVLVSIWNQIGIHIHVCMHINLITLNSFINYALLLL